MAVFTLALELELDTLVELARSLDNGHYFSDNSSHELLDLLNPRQERSTFT